MAITFENIIYDRVVEALQGLLVNEFTIPVYIDEHKGNQSFLLTPESDNINEYGNNFKMAENKYSRFDAYNDKFIVEIKYRNKCYDSVLIEFDKYAYNLLYAKQFGKQFLYIVKMGQVIYVFNVTKLDKRGYYFKWKWLEECLTSNRS